jgi:hypothetical protein
MVAVTYGVAGVPAVDTAANNTPKIARAETAAPRKHWLARLLDALIEARMQQARREIRMYTQLMPYTVDEQGRRQLKTEMNDMPFGGW